MAQSTKTATYQTRFSHIIPTAQNDLLITKLADSLPAETRCKPFFFVHDPVPRALLGAAWVEAVHDNSEDGLRCFDAVSRPLRLGA